MTDSCEEGVLYVSNVKAIKKNEKFDVIKIRVLLLNFQIPPPPPLNLLTLLLFVLSLKISFFQSQRQYFLDQFHVQSLCRVLGIWKKK